MTIVDAYNTNESVLQDVIDQLFHLWMLAETPIMAKHFREVHEITSIRLKELREVSYTLPIH